MKKNLIALVIVSVTTLAGVNRANAQVASNRSSLEYENTIEINKTTQAVNNSNELEGTSSRALKNFADTYKNVIGESWTKIKGGFSVRFTSDGIKTTIFYDSKGRWVSSIKYYNEAKMRHEVRHTVKSTYYDYDIIYAQEIETAETKGMPTYIICLEDKANIKMVRVFDGEMSVWKEYTRAN